MPDVAALLSAQEQQRLTGTSFLLATVVEALGITNGVMAVMVTIDGAVSSVTANGPQDYLPTAGDRVVLSIIGRQTYIVELLTAAKTISQDVSMAEGGVSIAGGSGAPTSAVITWGGTLNAGPSALTTPDTTAIGTTVTGSSGGGVSTTGLTVFVNRANSTATTVWYAGLTGPWF